MSDMRVLAWPATSDKNTHMSLLYSSIEPFGVEVDNFSAQAMLEGRCALDTYDLWHIHWPDHHFNTRNPFKAASANATVLGWFKEAKAKGVKLVWTVHNLRPHEKYHPYLEPFFYGPYTRMLDGWIALSQIAEREAKEKFAPLKETPSFVIPRGHYRDAHAGNIAKDVARERLGLPSDAKVLLNFGLIRDYKNIPHLIKTFRELERNDAILLIAGAPRSGKLEQEVREAVQGDPRVRLELSFIPDDALPTYFAASDLVTLPYKAIMHSGSAMMALSFNRPVLLPDIGALRELQAHVGDDWVRMFIGDLSVSELERSIVWAAQVAGKTADLAALSWDHIGKRTWQAFRDVLSGG